MYQNENHNVQYLLGFNLFHPPRRFVEHSDERKGNPELDKFSLADFSAPKEDSVIKSA